jgi:transaldolase
MKILLASCDRKIIEMYFKTGVFSGVISNPDVVAREKTNPLELFKSITRMVALVYYQIAAAGTEQMIEEARTFYEIDPQKMRIKVPATVNGLEVLSTLAGEGMHLMATCVPTRAWMIFAIEAGARVVAPYSGMLQRKGLCSKREEILAMQRIIDAQGYDVELCTGIYEVTDLPFYAAHGVKSCFIWGRDVECYLTQPLVDEAAESFRGALETIKNMY